MYMYSKRTADTLIRGCILRCLILVCNVCLCPTKRMLGLYGIKEYLRIFLYTLLTPKFFTLNVWQTVMTQMKCRIIAAFYLGLHCLPDENNLQRKNYSFLLEIITCDPTIYTMDQPMFIVSNQKGESISA